MPVTGSWDEHKAVLEAREPFRGFEYHRTLEDGTTQFVSASGEPVFDAEDRFIGYRGVATDITQRKRVNQSLRESERRFSDLLKNVALLSVMLDRSGCITYCNDFLLRLTGWRLNEVIGKDWFETFAPPELGDIKPVFTALLKNLPEAWHHDNWIFTRSGERRLIRWNNSVLRSPVGDVSGTASIGHDITDQKAAEARIIYLNHVYAVLSGINAVIVRANDRNQLFTEACQIAVNVGGFRMAMLGTMDEATGKFVTTASAGFDQELLLAINAVLSSKDTAALTIASRAIAEKRTIVSRDLQADPHVLFREKFAACGVHSVAILPLIVSGKAVGALTLYATETDVFHEEEIVLLTDLANDISFAIDHLDKQAQLNYLAYYDVLTGLANRSLFLERIAQYTITAGSRSHKLTLFLVDIERFKNINDSLGRVAGDSLLRQVAEWLIANAGDAYLMARVGGDQFALVLPEIRHDSGVIHLHKKKMDAFLKHPFQLNGTVFRVAFRVGVAVFPDDGVDADTLLKNAEAALKEAKARGERYLYYTSTMTEKVAIRLTLENQLRSALENGEFVLHYQPKLNLSTGKICGAEALIRWNDPRTGLVPPGLFIPVLEQTGLIHDVGRWAIRQAIEDYLRWRDLGTIALRITVNVSPLQLRDGDFVEEIRQAISVDLRARDGLELEITENVIMQDVTQSIKKLGTLRAMGVRVAIDDFGTGFSSLSYLSRLPADILKIDRSFVVDMTTGAQGLALVATIINLAHALNLNVVAEGVETEEQRRLLRLLNCDEMQGFLFSAAVPVENFEAQFLTSGSFL